MLAPARRAALLRSPFAVAVAGIALLGFLLRLALLLRSGGLTGDVGYDDGVYYAAADALVHGRLPYRDFLLLQPPGIVVVLAPFAALGTLVGDPAGLVTARLAFLAIGGVNAGLIAVVGRRYGRAAGATAGLAYAIFHPVVLAELGTLLEPLGTLLLLVALLLGRRAGDGVPRARLLAVVAGAAGAGAVATKIWYVVPLALLIAFQHRERLRMLLGAGVGAALLGLPFLLPAPGAAIREVLLDQVGRPRHADWTLPQRVASLGGWPVPRSGGLLGLVPPRVEVLVLLLVVAALTVATWTVREARMFPALLVACGAVLLAAPSYFVHYVALAAPWEALVLGIGAARVGALLGRSRAGTWAVAAVALGAVALVSVPGDAARVGDAVPARALAPAARAVRCVTTDEPVLLASLGVLSPDLARGCPLWPDLTGWTYDRDKGYGPGVPKELGRRENAPWQRHVLAYLRSGDAVILHRTATGLDRASLAAIDRGRVLARSGRWVLRAVAR